MLKPRNDYVLVELDAKTTTTPGGIELPQTYDEHRKMKRGTVLAVGPGLLNDSNVRLEMSLKPGDRIVMSPHDGMEVETDGKKCVIVQEGLVLATE